jgi:ubiquinone/menaquinone biosynthesis C-methylase UbiE
VDVDAEALALGRTLTDRIQFIRAPAEAIPLPSASFDLVISRVALPYTDVPRAVHEIARLLRPGGRCWIVLHPVAFAWKELLTQVRRARVKGVVYECYVLANGLLLHLFGRVIRYPLRKSRVESVQTVAGIRRVLQAAGFRDVTIQAHGTLTLVAKRP